MLLFNNFAFLIFLAVCISVYFLVPKKVQWIVLLIASYGFYLSFSWKFAFFVLATTVTIYLATTYISKLNAKQKQHLEENAEILDADLKKKYKSKMKKKKKTILVLTLLFNIGILVFLKYFNFFGSTLDSIFGWFSVKPFVPKLNLILPLGISFYTFQAVGYLVDCYWGKVEPEKNIFKFSLFISFFPQIVQGPISRYSELGKQLIEGHDFDFKKVISGGQLIIWGLFKKMIIADLLGTFVGNVFTGFEDYSGFIAVLGVLFYFIQDYADFSGCIDIARGSAECFGISLPQNFVRPYFSLTISEYWRRWHMTLGTWFKDYIFYPISISKFSLKLGKFSKKIFGKAGKNVPAIFGLIIVWLTTGLWHGASWNYVVWGLYFGLLVVLSIIFKPANEWLVKKLKINRKKFYWKAFCWIRTIILLLIGRTLFRAESLTDAWELFCKCFTIFNFDWGNIAFVIPNLGLAFEDMIVALVCTIILFSVDFIKERHPERSIRETVRNQKTFVSWSIYIFLIFCIVIFGAYGASYNPGDFIYMQF